MSGDTVVNKNRLNHHSLYKVYILLGRRQTAINIISYAEVKYSI